VQTEALTIAASLFQEKDRTLKKAPGRIFAYATETGAGMANRHDYPTVCLTILTKNSLHDREPINMISRLQIHTIHLEET
jgi:hypothetical protein